jgi:hypothetical protein
MLGGPRQLRDFLAAPTADVLSWLAGVEEPPTPVFLRALVLILDALDEGRYPGSRSPSSRPARHG